MGKSVIIRICHMWGPVSYKTIFYTNTVHSMCIYDMFTGLSLVIIRLNLTETVIENDLSLRHNDGSSFLLPQSVLVAAQSVLVAAQSERVVCKAKVDTVIYCIHVYVYYNVVMAVSYLFEGLKKILSIPLPESDPKYQSGV